MATMQLYKKSKEELIEIREKALSRIIEYPEGTEKEKIKIQIKQLTEEIEKNDTKKNKV